MNDKHDSFQSSRWILQDLLHAGASAQSHWEDCGGFDDGSDAEKPLGCAIPSSSI